ncbi:MAG: methyltransferase domain-containing protein [Patescibacteria group bacterium]
MDKEIKKEKLIKFAKSVLADPEHSDELKQLLIRLLLTEDVVIQTYVNYDLDIFAYKNEIYESLPMRFVLYMHNVLRGSWHIERQQLLFDLVKKHSPKTLADVGFGIPGKYTKEYVLKERCKTILLDCFPSALQFAKELLALWDTSWNKTIELREYNMDTLESPGQYDGYIFWDSIEHTKDPTKYLQMIVKASPANATFFFSIPIGPPVPVHFMSWETEAVAEKWLNDNGLQVLSRRTVQSNPQVDLFADSFTEPFYNLIVDCKKN